MLGLVVTLCERTGPNNAGQIVHALSLVGYHDPRILEALKIATAISGHEARFKAYTDIALLARDRMDAEDKGQNDAQRQA